jgi:ADP-ribose pyrophosphatase YjhB (NUDIX family)
MDLVDLVQRLRRIAQAGLAYSESHYDLDRYSELLKLAAEVAAGRFDAPASRIEDLLRAEPGYPTPKVDVRAVVVHEGKLLLVREISDGRWSLPGGWADVGESAADVTVREVLEETGYVVRARRLLALYDRAKHEHPRDLWWVYKVFFQCELTGGEARPSHETVDVAFFTPEELPPLSVPRNTEKQIRRMLELVAHPDWPADFD